MSTLATSIQHNFGSPSHGNQKSKMSKRNRKRKKIFSVCRWPYIENPKDATRKILELINEFSNVAGFKINAQKPLAFQYTNNENQKEELRKQLHFFLRKQLHLPLEQQQQKKTRCKPT